ncbi:hypothetical protein P8452_20296 [Trifolium repens]|nr:hypothetical protein P8452_20296 [Trifolium repens]
MKKAPGTVTCDRCKGVGHNKRSCKGKTAADRLIPKGGNKSNTSVKHPEVQPAASVSHIQRESQIGAQNGAQNANIGTQSGSVFGAQSGAKTGAKIAAQGKNVTTSNAKKGGAKRGRKKKNEDAMGTQQSTNKS